MIERKYTFEEIKDLMDEMGWRYTPDDYRQACAIFGKPEVKETIIKIHMTERERSDYLRVIPDHTRKMVKDAMRFYADQEVRTAIMEYEKKQEQDDN